MSAGTSLVPEALKREFAELERSGADTLPWSFANLVGGAWCRRMAADLLALAAEWKPDLIVREATEYGGCVAAEVLGIPHAAVRPRPAESRLSYEKRAGLAPVLARRREEVGLFPDPDNQMPHRYLELAFLPLPFFGAAGQFSERTHFVNFGLEGLELSAAGGASERFAPGDGLQSVYVSLGTLCYAEPGVMDAIIGALCAESLHVLVSAGDEGAATRLRGLIAGRASGRGTMTVRAHVDQLTALRSTDGFVTHAGINSLREAVSLGVPMVVVPVRDDQPFNAQRCVALGVARQVAPADRCAAEIAEAVRDVLDSPAYREASARVRDSIASLPAVGRAVELLEELVGGRRVTRGVG